MPSPKSGTANDTVPLENTPLISGQIVFERRVSSASPRIGPGKQTKAPQVSRGFAMSFIGTDQFGLYRRIT